MVAAVLICIMSTLVANIHILACVCHFGITFSVEFIRGVSTLSAASSPAHNRIILSLYIGVVLHLSDARDTLYLILLQRTMVYQPNGLAQCGAFVYLVYTYHCCCCCLSTCYTYL